MRTKEPQADLLTGVSELNGLAKQLAAVLETATFERRGDDVVACLYELDSLGQKISFGSSAEAAARKAIIDAVTLLVSDVTASRLAMHEEGAEGKDAETERFQAKSRNQTIGVTLPAALKAHVTALATEQDESVSEIFRRFTSFGFDDFEQRSLFVSSRTVFQTLGMELQQWQGEKSEQVMMRLEPSYVVRLKAAAKEHLLSASEMGALCVAHGLAMSQALKDLDARVHEYRGPSSRDLAVKIGLDRSAGRLIAGVLEGTTRAPRALLAKLATVLSAPESLLAAYFRRSFDLRIVPSFKAEHGKPIVHTRSTRWEAAVKAGGFTSEQTKALLELGA